MHKFKTNDQNEKGNQLKGWYLSMAGVKFFVSIKNERDIIRRTMTKLKLCQIPN
jgi:hypothetical protein